MRTKIFSILTFLLTNILIWGCKEEINQPYVPQQLPFRLMLQKGFQHDSVTFKIGDRDEDRWNDVTTNMFDSSAGQLQTSLLEGTYKFSFSVLTHNIIADTTFVLKNDALFIGVEYFRTDRVIKFTFSNNPFPNWTNL